MNKHYVYMIEERGSVTDLAVKIGVSADINRRILDMQTGNPRILKLALKFGPFSECEAFAMEAKMHHCFERFHVRGEWYDAEILTLMCLLEKYEQHQRQHQRTLRRDSRNRKRDRAMEIEATDK